MPDVELNTNNVYSRLYNNYILKYKNLKEKIKHSKNSSAYFNRSFFDANNSKNNSQTIFSYQNKNKNNNSKKISKIKLNKKIFFLIKNHPYLKNIFFKLLLN